jgi:hypothetical protein
MSGHVEFQLTKFESLALSPEGGVMGVSQGADAISFGYRVRGGGARDFAVTGLAALPKDAQQALDTLQADHRAFFEMIMDEGGFSFNNREYLVSTDGAVTGLAGAPGL